MEFSVERHPERGTMAVRSETLSLKFHPPADCLTSPIRMASKIPRLKLIASSMTRRDVPLDTV